MSISRGHAGRKWLNGGGSRVVVGLHSGPTDGIVECVACCPCPPTFPTATPHCRPNMTEGCRRASNGCQWRPSTGHAVTGFFGRCKHATLELRRNKRRRATGGVQSKHLLWTGIRGGRGRGSASHFHKQNVELLTRNRARCYAGSNSWDGPWGGRVFARGSSAAVVALPRARRDCRSAVCSSRYPGGVRLTVSPTSFSPNGALTPAQPLRPLWHRSIARASYTSGGSRHRMRMSQSLINSTLFARGPAG